MSHFRAWEMQLLGTPLVSSCLIPLSAMALCVSKAKGTQNISTYNAALIASLNFVLSLCFLLAVQFWSFGV